MTRTSGAEGTRQWHLPAPGTRNPAARAAAAEMATAQQDGGKGKASSQIWSVPRMTFFQCFALHLLCTDPWENSEDGEEACPPPGSFSARFQLLTHTNILPGPGNSLLLNLTLGNVSELFWM